MNTLQEKLKRVSGLTMAGWDNSRQPRRKGNHQEPCGPRARPVQAVNWAETLPFPPAPQGQGGE